MRELRAAASGRYTSTVGFRKLSVAGPEQRYELLVFDRKWSPVVPLNEWYRLHKDRGSPRTRQTYLAMLCPFLGYLLDHAYQWNAEPDAVREYTRQYLIESGCVVRPAWQTDGYQVALTNRTTMSPSGLGLFIAAARDFYATLIEGEWDSARNRHVTYYGYANPMYSEMLLRWKREHLRTMANAGAPDVAGIRGESRSRTAQQPVGYFRRTHNVWNPPVAREAEIVRVLIVAAILWMSEHATLRDELVIRILMESGARLHEVLGLTAGGYRRGRSMHVGVSALVRNKGSLGRETKPIHFEAETERLLRRYIRTDRATNDPGARSRLEQLDDADPIFLSSRCRQLSDAAFRAQWAKLRTRVELRFRRAPVRLPHLHPHLIRHAHATMRVSSALEAYPDSSERQRAAVEAVQVAMGWASAETAKRYVHAISTAEAQELIQRRFIDRLVTHARDLPTAMAQIRDSKQTDAKRHGLADDKRDARPGRRRATDGRVDHITWEKRRVRSAYTAGPVQPAGVNWAELLTQAQAQAPASAILDPASTGGLRAKSAAYLALPPEQQLHVFLASLPSELIRAPRIDWARVPSKTRVYLLYGRGSRHPDRSALALASGIIASNGVLPSTVYVHVSALTVFWAQLLERYHLRSVAELTYDHWMNYGSDRERMRQRTMQLQHYQAAALHVREYLHSLGTDGRADLKAVVFPEAPPRFNERFVPVTTFMREMREERKAKTDVLVPLTTTLVALILERKKAAQRFLEWFRAQIAAIEHGELQIPADVEYQGYELGVNRDAASVEDVRWVRRDVRLRATVWDPRTYAQHRHDTARAAEKLALGIRKQARARGHDWIYTPDLPDRYFLQLHDENPVDLPWPVSIIAHGGFLGSGHRGNEISTHGGLATPSHVMAYWFTLQRDLYRRAVEPEALYRGVLYGATLAILALTSDARHGELVQVSADRFEPPRPYVVKDEAGEALLNPATGRPRYSVIVLQRLLPKGRRHDSERNLFNVSAAALLLQEISDGLRARHGGEIPRIAPRRSHTKAEDLKPERYLLQWNQLMVHPMTVNGLIRFIVHGLELRDINGKPFRVHSHLLRHVGATAARHEFGLPLDIMADILSHTRDRDGHAPEATSYYTRLPLEQRLVEQQRALDRMLDKADAAKRQIAPIDAAVEAQRILARSDERTREVLERWHTYHPVVFGHCGRAGLCVRGTNRVLCLGCPFLVPRPEFKHRVDTYLRAYEQMAEQLEVSGNPGEAMEHRRLADQCRKLRHEMCLLEQAETSTQAGLEHWALNAAPPVADTVPIV